MEKPGLEHAVMILGAGASILHFMRNISVSFGKYKNNTTAAAAQKPEFSGILESISGWTGRLIMSLILISSVYHLFFAGENSGRLVYCFGIISSLVYFISFTKFNMINASPTAATKEIQKEALDRQ